MQQSETIPTLVTKEFTSHEYRKHSSKTRKHLVPILLFKNFTKYSVELKEIIAIPEFKCSQMWHFVNFRPFGTSIKHFAYIFIHNEMYTLYIFPQTTLPFNVFFNSKQKKNIYWKDRVSPEKCRQNMFVKPSSGSRMLI